MGRQKCLDLCVRLVVKSLYPFNIVKDESFRKIIEGSGSGMTVVCKKTLNAGVISKAMFATELLKEKLRESPYDKCLSMDLWTNKKMESFMGVTCHFFLDGKVHDVILHFGRFDAQALSDNLASELKKIIEIHRLHGQIASFTVGNGKSGQSIQKLGIEPTRCAAHVLNIAVNDGLAAFGNRAQNLCMAVRNRKILKTRFLLMQGARAKNLILDAPTCWNSTYDFIDRLTELRMFVRQLIRTTPSHSEFKLTREEWEELEKHRDFLMPFKKATDYLSSSRYPSTSIMYMFWKHFLDPLNLYRPRNLGIAATAIQSTLTKYWSYGDLNILVAHILDPRFKDVVIPKLKRSPGKKYTID